MVAQFTLEEWRRYSQEPVIKGETPYRPLLSSLGWAGYHIIVFDLQTC